MKLLFGILAVITIALSVIFSQQDNTLKELNNSQDVITSSIVAETLYPSPVEEETPYPSPSTDPYPYPVPDPTQMVGNTDCDLWWVVCYSEQTPTQAPTETEEPN